MAEIDPTVFNLIIFVLAIFVGYYVVWSVTPALHTPLMSVTNAISSVIIVGALIATGAEGLKAASWFGFVAVILAAVNIFGGFMVTQRMLGMYRKRELVAASMNQRRRSRLSCVGRRVCFILALRGLSSPATARQGNLIGIAGMAIAILFTLLTLPHASIGSYLMILIGIAIGGAIGVAIARRIPMTAMPQLVAAFHSLVGMAAVLVAAAALYNPAEFHITTPAGAIQGASLFEMGLGVIIGAITFSGSVIAFAKLQALMRSAPILLAQRHLINGAIGAAILLLLVVFVASESVPPSG